MLLFAVILGDGVFVVLQVPSPSFLGFGLTPFPALAAETLAYLLGGLLLYRLHLSTNKYLYGVSFLACIGAAVLLAFADLPDPWVLVLQLLVYASLALLNLCWGVCFASFKPAVSMVLVVGSYLVWSICSLGLSLAAPYSFAEALGLILPFASLVVLGFCLARLDFGAKRRSRPSVTGGAAAGDQAAGGVAARIEAIGSRAAGGQAAENSPERKSHGFLGRGKGEQKPSFKELFAPVAPYCAASLAFSFIFGSIMQIDILQGYAQYIVSPEAQVGCIAVSLAMLVYVLRDGSRVRYRVLIAVPLVLATVLMARAVLEGESFFTSGLPTAVFNFFGQLVWIVFAWKAYESKANPLCVFALGLGSMRLGLLGGRGFAVGLSQAVGLSPAVANAVSIVGLWVVFIAVIAAVLLILKRQNIEQLPFEAEEADGAETPGASGWAFAAPGIRTDGLPGADGTSDSRMAGTLGYRGSATAYSLGYPDGQTGILGQVPPEQRFAEAVKGSGLTEREQEILRMYASGRSAAYIAEELFLSNYTVKTHLRRSYAKLGVHTRQALLDLIWKQG
jgi:DNA-binding CsgD family transcriptional regulator